METNKPDNNHHDGPSLRTIVLQGGVFLYIRQLFSIGLSLIGVIIITRVIGPERYGSYAAAFAVSQFFLLVGPLGISVYLIRQSGPIDDKEYALAATLLLSISLAAILFIESMAGLIGSWIRATDVEQLLRALALVLPAQMLSLVANARLERNLDYRRIGVIEVSGHVIYYAAAVPLALSGFGSWSLAAGWCFQQFFLCVALHYASHHKVRFAWSTTIARRMFTFTIGYSTANCLWQLRYLVNPFIIGHFLGADSVGQIGLTIRLVEILSFVRGITIRLSIAALARIQNRPDKLLRAITQGMQLQILAIGPVLLAFAWFGPSLLPHLFGERWQPVMDIYPFIAIGYLTSALFTMHTSSLSLLHRNSDVSLFNILHLSLFVPTVLFAVRHFGIIGYGVGELVALLSYPYLHLKLVRAIGRPNYSLALLWWSGAGIGLFWKYFGWWAIACTFAVLLWPASIRQLKDLLASARGSFGRKI